MKERWLWVLLLLLLRLRQRFCSFIIFLYLWNNKLKKQVGTWQYQVFKKSGCKNFPIFQEFETWNHDTADVEINNSLFICFTLTHGKPPFLNAPLRSVALTLRTSIITTTLLQLQCQWQNFEGGEINFAPYPVSNNLYLAPILKLLQNWSYNLRY